VFGCVIFKFNFVAYLKGGWAQNEFLPTCLGCLLSLFFPSSFPLYPMSVILQNSQPQSSWDWGWLSQNPNITMVDVLAPGKALGLELDEQKSKHSYSRSASKLGLGSSQ
jgi:hypothetical protein